MGMNARALAKRFDREVLAEQFVDTLEQVA
jgi:hypothetical protein